VQALEGKDMGEDHSSEERLEEEVRRLRQETALFKTKEAAFEAQRKLLENVVTVARSPIKGDMLRATLQKTLDVTAQLVGAETGSMFLIDSKGFVTDSILVRKDVTQEQGKRLIKRVMDKGLAGWVSRHRRVGLAGDTLKDDRWIALPDPPYLVRSVVCVPILHSDELLGIITLQHSRAAHFTSQAADLMQVTADQLSLVLENARLYARLQESLHTVEAYSNALDSELEEGRKIQKDFLPDRFPQHPDWDIASCFYPARKVAGDFYDAFPLPDGCMGLVIADVCDKGVGAALFMALFQSLIRIFSGQTRLWGLPVLAVYQGGDNLAETQAENETDMTSALKAVAITNDYIAQEHGQMCMYATLFFGILNPETGSLAYINGGHLPLFIVGKDGIKQSLGPTGPAVGMMPRMEFKTRQVQLEPGDTLIGYTDGVIEACSPGGKIFTSKRLLSLLEQPVIEASDLLERIKTDLFAYIDNTRQSDDITMLAVHRIG